MGSVPTHFYVPEGARFTLADEICDLMEAVGYQVDEPERLAAHALYAQRSDGDWIGLESGIVGPRQNLKTAVMIGGALHDAFVQGVNVAWTAHEFKTSAEAFRDMTGIIEGHDWLASEVLNIRTAHGFEGFDLRNGARLDVIARTGKSGRGMGRMRLYLDEALFAMAQMMGAIVPTMSAMPNAHMVIGSSPGKLISAVLRNYRKRGRSGVDRFLGWIEWSQDQGACASEDCRHEPGTDGCWLDDLEAVLQVNPAAPHRISLDYLEQERQSLSGDSIPEYLRERMGVWEDPIIDEGADSPWPVEEWASRQDETSTVDASGQIVLAVDVSWDRSRAWIGLAGMSVGGAPHVEIAHTGYGTDWVVSWLAERVEARRPLAIGVQGGNSPASSLLDPLKKAFGDLVQEMTGPDMTRATGTLFDAIKAGPLVHIGQEQLDEAIKLTVPRILGDGWVPDRKVSSVDIAGLVSVIEALYLLQTVPEPEPSQSYAPRRLRR